MPIHGHEAVKGGVIRSGDARQRHQPSVVDQNVNAAELFFRSVEQARYLDRFADIGSRADRTPFVRVDFLNDRRSFRFTTTAKPSCASRLATTLPMPRDAPVTMAVLVDTFVII